MALLAPQNPLLGTPGNSLSEWPALSCNQYRRETWANNIKEPEKLSGEILIEGNVNKGMEERH